MMDYAPRPTPIWLTDSDYPAPCPCGRPMLIGEPLVEVEGEHGLRRIVHASCLQGIMGVESDDDVG